MLFRCRHKVYYLTLPGRRLVLEWSPFTGYRCDALSVIEGGKVVQVIYFT